MDVPAEPHRARPPSLGRAPAPSVLVGLLLLVLAALAFVPGQASVPPIDRDEPRYTQATKQMLETGDYVRIRFQDGPRHKKPVGIHWLQAGAASLFGGADAPLMAYRLPSLIGAIAAALLTVWAARAFLPLGAALIVGGLFAATIILGVEARLAKTDAVLLATVIAAQGALARLWLSAHRPLGMAVVFWFALALGILVKGPIAPLVVGLTLATLLIADRRALPGALRPLLGLSILGVIALPWYVAIYLATDGAFYAAAVGYDFLGKAATGREGHGAPPLTHLALFFVIAWPLSAFALAGLWRVWHRRGPVFLFALAWALPAWVVFEIVSTKLPHYTLPMVPAIAIAAVAAAREADPPRWIKRLAALLLAAVPLALLIGTPVLTTLLSRTFEGALQAPLALLLAAFALGAGLALVAAVSLWRGAPLLSRRPVAAAIGAAAVAQAAVWGFAIPSIQPVWLSSRVAAVVDAYAGCAAPRLVSVGFEEPSLVFLTATNTQLFGAEAAGEALASAAALPCAVLSVRAEALDEARRNAAAADVALSELATVRGFNISKGDVLTLTLFAVSPGPTEVLAAPQQRLNLPDEPL